MHYLPPPRNGRDGARDHMRLDRPLHGLVNAFQSLGGKPGRLGFHNLDLSDERKQQVESATQAFAAEVETVAADLRSDLSLSGAQAKLQAAGQQLASSYQQAFATVDCG